MNKIKIYTMEVKNDTGIKCLTCGHDAYLEPNYNRSYVMCMFCFREYKGGYEELYLLNGEKIHELKTDKTVAVKE